MRSRSRRRPDLPGRRRTARARRGRARARRGVPLALGAVDPGGTASTRRPPGCTPSSAPPSRPPVPVIFDATAPAFAGHDRADMLRLAEYAAAVGVETFLLDLDWCVRAGLDPYADHEVRAEAGTPDDLARAAGPDPRPRPRGRAGPATRSGSTRSRRSPATTRSGCSRSSATAWSNWCWICPSGRRWAMSGSG